MAIWLVRHGETEWSISGQHTGNTDIALTPQGRLQAVAIGKLLAGRRFDHILASPMLRAQETGRLAGFGDRIRVHEGLLEYDYGEFEGLTTQQISIRYATNLRLDAGTISIVTDDRDGPALVLWNRRVQPRAMVVADIAASIARTVP